MQPPAQACNDMPGLMTVAFSSPAMQCTIFTCWSAGIAHGMPFGYTTCVLSPAEAENVVDEHIQYTWLCTCACTAIYGMSTKSGGRLGWGVNFNNEKHQPPSRHTVD